MIVNKAPGRTQQTPPDTWPTTPEESADVQVEPSRAERRIMVQIADPNWTRRAIEYACPLALDMNAEIILLDLVPVQHLGWLGTELGYPDLSETEYARRIEYTNLVRSYGISVTLQPFQYATLCGALVDGADYVGAAIVFVTLPVGLIPRLQQFQMSRLQRQLAARGRQFMRMG